MKISLKSKKDISKLFDSGKSYSSNLIFAKVLESNESKFIFTVSKKKFKRAVDRNRIKRLMREVVAKSEINNKNIAFIFTGVELPTYTEVELSINKIISRI
jgi:ribonuclease P protein component